MRPRALPLLVFLGVLAFGLTSRAASFSAAVLNTASDSTVETIPLEATVQEIPAKITIKTYAPGTFTISRKDPSSSSWIVSASNVTLAASGTWTDTNVSAGNLYEYQLVNTAGTVVKNYPTGYILTGIKVDQTQPKGRMAVVVASDVPSTLPTEYATYKTDLVADGWTVHEVQVPRAANYNGIGNGAIATVTVNAGGNGSISSGSTTKDIVYLVNSSGKKAEANLSATSGTIKTVTIFPQGGGRGFSVGDSLTVLGGHATGANCILQWHIDQTQLAVSSFTPYVYGTGYSGDSNGLVTVTGQISGLTATGLLANTSDGKNGFVWITNVTSSGTTWVYKEPLTLTCAVTGSGVGNLYCSSTNGKIQKTVAPYGFGSGYPSGGTATLTGDSSGKTAQVTLTTDDFGYGGILGATIISQQSGFTKGETFTLSAATTGSGAGPFKAAFMGPLQSVSVYASGSNYVNGNVVTLNTSGTGILNVTGGAITGVTITNSGTNNFVDLALFAPDPSELISSATGYNLTVATVDNSGVGKGLTVTGGGSGYLDNDRVTLRGVTSGATAAGSIIAPSGSVTGISAVLPNTFTAGETVTVTAASGGTGATATAGPQTEYHLLIRSAIQALYNAYPGQFQNVSMVGKVPVCRSGLDDSASIDGHGNEAPYGADAFYADMDGVVGTNWTDVGKNLRVYSTTYPLLSNYNFPGDLQFDQQKISQVGNGKVELGFGRIDLSCGIQTDMEALRTYFNKLHLYKIADPSFQPGRRVCDRNETLVNVRDTELQSMPGVVGMSNVEFYNVTDLPVVANQQDADQLFSAQHGPYLFYFKGSSGPAEGAGGRAVFWTGFQSHYGFWYSLTQVTSDSNGMQKSLAENSYTLSWTWDGWGLRYIYHRMGMGLDAGDMMKQSINNQGWLTGPYTYKFNNTANGDFHGALFMNHMGDPALRLFMFQPPSALSVVKSSGSNPVLTWTASPDVSASSYHVYRADTAAGPFTRLTSTPLTTPTYTDTSVTSGSYTYMVRAVRLETTGGGTYYNASLGITQSINLNATPTAVSIATTSLSNLNWNGSNPITLSATGGVPVYTWALVSGTLPQGLSLSTNGVISGSSTLPGVYTFTVRATDQIGQSVTQLLSLTVNSDSGQVLYPEATTYTDKSQPAINYGYADVDSISGIAGYSYETFHRYDLSGLTLNNGFIKATLYLYPTSATDPNACGYIQANLIADSQDAWVDNSIAKPFSGYANNGSNQVRITGTGHGFTTGNLVTIAGLAGTGIPVSGSSYAITVVDANHFDLPVTYAAGWTYTAASAFATTVGMTYNNRPTLYNSNVPTLISSTTPVVGTPLQIDVTSFVAETLAHDSTKKMSLRLFSKTPQTLAIGSLHAYGGAIPYLLIETSDAPNIVINSPTVNPACIPTGMGILLSTTVTPISARVGSTTLQWSQVSGSGTVTFSNPTSASTTASFSAAGDYVVRLTANDGVAQSSKDITIRALSAAVTGPTDSLLLRLPLNEGAGSNAIDYSGVIPANSGTLNALAGWSATGKIGGALSLGGTANYAVIPDSASYPLDGMQKMTISVWINQSAADASGSFFRTVFCKRKAAFQNQSYSLSIRGGGGTIYAYLNNGSIANGQVTISPNQWYHLALVFDGSLSTNNLKLYVNGVPGAFATIYSSGANLQTSVPRNSVAPFYVGAADNADTTGFNGLIDEVRVYNRALNETEIMDLYSAAPANMGPVVSAGPSVSGTVGGQVALTGTATDDGLPSSLAVGWSVLSGPGTVSFGNAAAAATTASFAQAGSYSLMLMANDGAITTWANTTATIVSPYNVWAAAHGLTGGNAVATACPAGDKVTNLMKYALGLDPSKVCVTPTDGTTAGLPLETVGASTLSLTYQKDTSKTDISYRVEAGSDLSSWSNNGVTEQILSTNGTIQTIKASVSTVGNSKQFIRLKVTQ